MYDYRVYRRISTEGGQTNTERTHKQSTYGLSDWVNLAKVSRKLKARQSRKSQVYFRAEISYDVSWAILLGWKTNLLCSFRIV